MPQALKATYRSGTFILNSACNLPEGAEVELFVKLPQVIPPQITDIAARQDFLKLIVMRMQQNPIPFNAPRFTRDMLYESR
ncbi:MAG: antitoxin family protein [Flavobacteriaceae bacterium]